jgi:hypothetical protein
VALAYVKQSGGSYLLLVGLGHKGLPRELFERARYHLDITGQGVPLETCTAIGAVPAVLASLVGGTEDIETLHEAINKNNHAGMNIIFPSSFSISFVTTIPFVSNSSQNLTIPFRSRLPINLNRNNLIL